VDQPDAGGDLPDTPDAGDASDAADDGGSSFEIQVVWEPCPVVPSDDENTAECATVEVPLDWDEPDGDLIELFVRRLSAGEQSTGQYWFSPGGPGFSNQSNGSLLPFVQGDLPTFDVYIMDHRGTGLSTSLDCPDQQDADSESGLFVTLEEWPDCIDAVVAEWGDALDHFTTTQAAHDYAAMIAATRPEFGDVYLHGLSYGTFLVQRFLQLYPDELGGVILDGLVPPAASLHGFDETFDASGQQLMTACAADPVCGEKLGDDPWAVAQAVVAGIDEGDCSDAEIDPVLLRRALGGLVNSQNIYRGLVPALIYRLQRCDPADVDAWNEFIVAAQVSPQPPAVLSPFLGNHILITELWENELTPDEADAAELELTMTSGSPSFISRLEDLWPVYTPDELDGEWAEASVPILMLTAEIDGRTPLEYAHEVADHFDGDHQTLLEFPYAHHNVYGSATRTNGLPCATDIVRQFVTNPRMALDTSCIADTIDPALASQPDFLPGAFFQTQDLWENEE